MLINILKLYLSPKIVEKQIFNRIFVLSFFSYLFLYIIFKNKILLIALFDIFYFLYSIIQIEKINKSKNSNNGNITNIHNINSNITDNINNINGNITDNINNINGNITDNITKILQNLNIDPEFKKENFIPYKYNLKETIKQITSNI